jgi:hypothetical protein
MEGSTGRRASRATALAGYSGQAERRHADACVNNAARRHRGESAGVQQTLPPDVLNINYDIEPDWSGDWGIFFPVLLSDDASAARLREVTNDVVSRMSELIDFPSLGVFAYFNFRSRSEQDVLREEAWA